MYENILSALGQKSSASGLTYSEVADNYRLFDELQKKGIRLKDIVERAESTSRDSVSPDVLRLMEAEVKDDTSVKEAKSNLNNVRMDVLDDILSKDERYREAVSKYRGAVSEAYSKRKTEPKTE